MLLPFTREQFFEVFAAYNAALGSAVWIAYALGAVALVAAARRRPGSGRIVSACLAAMWVWTGVAYHGLYFASINAAARVFAGLFVLQGLALLVVGVVGRRLRHADRRAPWPLVGWGLVVYAVALYPAIGLASGHAWQELPMFGITPCPLTIFSIGLLLMAGQPLPITLVLIPVAWSLIGGSATLLLGVPQDAMLPLSGVLLIASRWWPRAAPVPAS